MFPVAVDALVDLVLPARCAGCGVDGTALCGDCRAHDGPVRVPLDGLDVVAATRYEGPARRLLIAYKERGRRDLARPLGLMLAAAVLSLLADVSGRPGQLALVSVPSSRRAAAGRGGDHMARLARRAAAAAGVRVAPNVARLHRQVRDSAGLGIAERRRNLHGAIGAHAPPSRVRAAVIVDDIVTTGATLREVDRALRAAGWPVLGAAVVAATPRRVVAYPLAGPR